MPNRVIGPLFFAEQTVTATTYCVMLKDFMASQVEDIEPTVIF
jgi:hypothetical protein